MGLYRDTRESFLLYLYIAPSGPVATGGTSRKSLEKTVETRMGRAGYRELQREHAQELADRSLSYDPTLSLPLPLRPG